MKDEETNTVPLFKEHLENDTLSERFQGPVLLVTYDGIKKVTITDMERYELHTSAGTIAKTDVVFCLLADAAAELGDYLRLNKTLQAENLRTAKKQKDRPKIINKRPLRSFVGKGVKVTMRNGHVIYGIPEEYSEYNFTMNVNDQIVLIYRHAVYQFDVIKKGKQ